MIGSLEARDGHRRMVSRDNRDLFPVSLPIAVNDFREGGTCPGRPVPSHDASVRLKVDTWTLPQLEPGLVCGSVQGGCMKFRIPFASLGVKRFLRRKPIHKGTGIHATGGRYGRAGSLPATWSKWETWGIYLTSTQKKIGG